MYVFVQASCRKQWVGGSTGSNSLRLVLSMHTDGIEGGMAAAELKVACMHAGIWHEAMGKREYWKQQPQAGLVCAPLMSCTWSHGTFSVHRLCNSIRAVMGLQLLKALCVHAGILQEAMGRREYWRLVDGQGRPPGLMGMWPSRAVTFIENHDTGDALCSHSKNSLLALLWL